VRRLAEVFPLEPLPASAAGETAQRWRYRDGAGEVGVISSVTQAFCGECNRARLSTEGKLFMCLFASQGHDLRALLRGTAGRGPVRSDDEIAAAIGALWQDRQDRYSELRSGEKAPATSGHRRIEMHYIGG
jgi:cyclic pyranopterin phosphate synthase